MGSPILEVLGNNRERPPPGPALSMDFSQSSVGSRSQTMARTVLRVNFLCPLADEGVGFKSLSYCEKG